MSEGEQMEYCEEGELHLYCEECGAEVTCECMKCGAHLCELCFNSLQGNNCLCDDEKLKQLPKEDELATAWFMKRYPLMFRT